jgi:hypothetical protein
MYIYLHIHCHYVLWTCFSHCAFITLWMQLLCIVGYKHWLLNTDYYINTLKHLYIGKTIYIIVT